MNWRRLAIVSLIVLPILILLAFGMTRDPRELPSTLPGRAAPSFSLAVMENPDLVGVEVGDTVRLADHEGEAVVLNFWASWCLACRDEHRPLSQVAERYRDDGVNFYGVLYNDSPQNGLRWIRQMGGQSYPSLIDPGARTAIDYGLYGVPETFFIDADGVVAYKHIGPVDEAVLTRWAERLRPDAEVAHAEEGSS